MTTAKNEILFDLQDENCYLVGELIFGGGNKNLVGGLRGGFFSRCGEMIKLLRQIVQKHTHMNLRNLLNG